MGANIIWRPKSLLEIRQPRQGISMEYFKLWYSDDKFLEKGKRKQK
jgi:hypothetical protein